MPASSSQSQEVKMSAGRNNSLFPYNCTGVLFAHDYPEEPKYIGTCFQIGPKELIIGESCLHRNNYNLKNLYYYPSEKDGIHIKGTKIVKGSTVN